MQERQYYDASVIVEQDILSGRSKVAQTLTNWALSFGGGSTNSIVVSYSKTPNEILQLVSTVKGIIISDNGEIGTTANKKTYKIGEYRMIASDEHSFNAVIFCFYGGDFYNLNNSNDCSVYLAATGVESEIRGINDVGGVKGLQFFVSSSNGFTTISFDQRPIAQQVYDCDIWDNCRGKSTTSTNPPEWFIAASTKKKSGGGCYIATAVYGSYDCPEVWTLRRYRDYTLAETWYGRMFIRTYYAISPTIVKWFGSSKWFNRIWRNRLDQIIVKLKEKGYLSSPYTDKKWR